MISVVIPTSNSVRELEPLLASLVPGVVDGLIGDVLLADVGSTDATAALCEDAGVTIVVGDISAAAQSARSERVLLLPVGLRLPHDWVAKLGAHMASGGGDAVLQGTWRNARWFGPHIGAKAVLTSRALAAQAGRGGIGSVRARLTRPAKLR